MKIPTYLVAMFLFSTSAFAAIERGAAIERKAAHRAPVVAVEVSPDLDTTTVELYESTDETLIAMGGVDDMGFATVVGVPITAAVSTSAAASAFPTADTPTDLGAAASLLPTLVKAVTEGDYTLAVALGLVLIVFVVRTFLWKTMEKKYAEWIPWALALTAAAMAVAGSLQMGSDPFAALLHGASAGLAAVGMNQLNKPIKKRWKKGSMRSNGKETP